MVDRRANKTSEDSRFVVLNKLDQLGPMNLLEIGFTATPFVIRNMAASGLVKVTVAMTETGLERLRDIKTRRLRRAEKARKAARPLRLLEVG